MTTTPSPIKSEKIEKTDILLKGSFSVAPADYASFKEKAFNNLAQGVSLPGFRAGKAPKQLLLERIGQGRLMDETARRVIEDAYPKIIRGENVRPVGDPHITITKCAADNPIEFDIEVPLYPPIMLPDYKKIAGSVFSEKKPEITIAEDEVDEAILNIKKYRQQKEDGTQEETLIDDAFAQSLGNFKDLADLKEKMKENLLLEKKQKEKADIRRSALLKVIEASTIPLPPQLIEGETEDLMLELKENTAKYYPNLG
jgi:FKBP-type peptidyl-prolyl cis-trans isomerase (trigger factor)